jgi:hypothetical protein
MSSEKPAEVPARWMEIIWSVYEVRGDMIKLNENISARNHVGLIGRRAGAVQNWSQG